MRLRTGSKVKVVSARADNHYKGEVKIATAKEFDMEFGFILIEFDDGTTMNVKWFEVEVVDE